MPNEHENNANNTHENAALREQESQDATGTSFQQGYDTNPAKNEHVVARNEFYDGVQTPEKGNPQPVDDNLAAEISQRSDANSDTESSVLP